MPHLADHTKNIIEVDHVSFSFNGHEVLTDVNLAIHRGDYLGLVGGNGSGKTTLIKIILGILTPSKGSVKLFGTDIHAFKQWHRVGYVPQKATSFDTSFPATVEEVVLMGRFGRRGLFKNTTQEDRLKVREALERVEMWEHRGRLIGDLSGGQQQRVFIARALAGEPEVLFLDEPTVGVEEGIQTEFYALLQKLNRDFHLTVVLVTHDINAIAKEAMHIACIDRTIFFHNSTESFLKGTHSITHTHD